LKFLHQITNPGLLPNKKEKLYDSAGGHHPTVSTIYFSLQIKNIKL